jgi:hypothetical protein
MNLQGSAGDSWDFSRGFNLRRIVEERYPLSVAGEGSAAAHLDERCIPAGISTSVDGRTQPKRLPHADFRRLLAQWRMRRVRPTHHQREGTANAATSLILSLDLYPYRHHRDSTNRFTPTKINHLENHGSLAHSSQKRRIHPTACPG